MSNQLYIDGKPASLMQRIAATIIAVVSLVFFAFFGIAIFLIGLAIALVFGGYFWWKVRKVRKQMEEGLRQAQVRGEMNGNMNNMYGFTQNNQNNPGQGDSTEPNGTVDGKANGKLYEGEYREL